jgi:tRNA A37 threonylcarbamoyladenosine synthetase subunit TsaC/SUA5/YrdC
MYLDLRDKSAKENQATECYQADINFHVAIAEASTSIKDDDEIIEYSTDPELIAEKYDHLVDIVIDSGYGDNIASTIVDLTSGEPEIIRQGKGNI